MKPSEIKALIDYIARSNLDEVSIETDNFKLSARKGFAKATGSEPAQVIPVLAAAHTPSVPASVTLAQAPAAVMAAPAAQAPASTEKLYEVKSPMIGTLYRSPSPDKPFFVNVGDEIKAGQTVCIIEAMKLFNEIESEVSGRIVKIMVENAQPVEFDQVLFLVEPA
jgi:acetyl-CoA carboxylase biotin carboxyl carrier protein